jgi:general secretion pathway protein A
LTAIYNDYFGLKESPFSIAPNPQYLYMSDRHRDALAHLTYGIQGDGAFILLTGEVGTGKTTVCRCLLDQIPKKVDTAFILNPKLTAAELLAAACDDLNIKYPKKASIKVLTDRINAYLLNAHSKDRRTVLIIDEAQNLSIEVLEQLRLLTNLETHQRKLLQIILLGQPELLTILAKPELRQLSQRITARFHLDALNRNEIAAYIKHRLVVAGAKGTFFPNSAMNRIYKISSGIPRVINLICDRSLLGAYSEGEIQVSPSIVKKAAKEILGYRPAIRINWQYAAITSTAALFVTILVFIYAETHQESPQLVTTNTTHPGPLESAVNQPVQTLPTAAAPLAAVDPRDNPAQWTAASAEPGNPPSVGETDRQDAVPDKKSGPPAQQLVGHETLGAALSDLLSIWGVGFTRNATTSCQTAETIGLFCYSSITGLNEINDFNRPVVVRLRNQWFTLESLNKGSASLKAGTRTYDLPIRQFIDNWDRNFTLLWRAPPAYKGPLSRGDRGPAIDWLVNRLALINAEPLVLTAGYIFDRELEYKVKQFQLSSGLTPDGIAGVKTWIKINDEDDSNTPRLTGGNS